MFVCRNHNPVLSSFITYHPGLLCDKSITTGVICGAGTGHSSGAPGFTSCLSGFRVARSFVFCVMFCKSWPFVIFFFFFFFFGYCAVCPSIYGFVLLLWYLQTLHMKCLTTRRIWNNYCTQNLR